MPLDSYDGYLKLIHAARYLAAQHPEAVKPYAGGRNWPERHAIRILEALADVVIIAGGYVR